MSAAPKFSEKLQEFIDGFDAHRESLLRAKEFCEKLDKKHRKTMSPDVKMRMLRIMRELERSMFSAPQIKGILSDYLKDFKEISELLAEIQDEVNAEVLD